MKTIEGKARKKNKELIKFRLDNDLTQQDLADKLGCSRILISQIESGITVGKPSFWINFKYKMNTTTEVVFNLMEGGSFDK